MHLKALLKSLLQVPHPALPTSARARLTSITWWMRSVELDSDDKGSATALVAGPKPLDPAPQGYDALRPCFAWLPANIVKRQRARLPFNSMLKKWHKPPNSTLVVMRRSKPVAADAVEPNAPAIDGGKRRAQIFVGAKTLATGAFGMKAQAQFPGELMDNITEHGAPTKLVSDCAQIEISKRAQEALHAARAGAWQRSEPCCQHQSPMERCCQGACSSTWSALCSTMLVPQRAVGFSASSALALLSAAVACWRAPRVLPCFDAPAR